MKEIKFRPKVDEHDYQFKKKHIERFLSEGDKVKATIFFRGRENAHPEIGRRILERLMGELADVAVPETGPAEGRQPAPHDSGPTAGIEAGLIEGFEEFEGFEGSSRGSETRMPKIKIAPWRSQALQEDGDGQVPALERVQTAHPDEQADAPQAPPARHRSGRQGRQSRV